MTAEPFDHDSYPDEADLVRRAKQRDESAWASWYDDFYPTIYKYALARLGRREDAEDIASQVFLEALRGIDGFVYRGRPVLAWLYGIGRNLIAQRLRRESRENRASNRLVVEQEPGTSADAIVDRLDLARALTALTPDQQDVIVLRFFLAMSVRETAQILGKSENAVPVLQVRAIAALRRNLSSATLQRLLSSQGGRP